jgi:uncharacterized OsmC-like protein
MAENGTFSVRLERVQNYEFMARFDWKHVAPIKLDEPEPLGNSSGPNAARLLAAAIGNCLSASLLFCLEKAKIEVKNIKTEVSGMLRRNENGRLRIGRLDVHLIVDLAAENFQRISRCLDLFEDYCVVTASVRKSIPVSIVVTDIQGKELYRQS